MLQRLEEKTMRGNTVYLCLILCFILHNVESKNRGHTRSEWKPDSKNPIRASEKIDMSKFVDDLLEDAKRIDQKHKKIGKTLPKTAAKTITKTVDEGLESSYDSLGLDENKKDLIVRSNKPSLHLQKTGHVFRSNDQGLDNNKMGRLDLQKIGQLFRSNNEVLNYKKLGQILRSNAGSDDLKIPKAVLRSVNRPSDEEGAELLFDLEDDDGLKNPLF